ncbi:hypothetical protein C4573_04615 [Candidatus Woesearchaeota archaeon]|nr:MAG: hypothetical protein C4573_04615 [Candidatus Woesearchaeota archaeon]
MRYSNNQKGKEAYLGWKGAVSFNHTPNSVITCGETQEVINEDREAIHAKRRKLEEGVRNGIITHQDLEEFIEKNSGSLEAGLASTVRYTTATDFKDMARATEIALDQYHGFLGCIGEISGLSERQGWYAQLDYAENAQGNSLRYAVVKEAVDFSESAGYEMTADIAHGFKDYAGSDMKATYAVAFKGKAGHGMQAEYAANFGDRAGQNMTVKVAQGFSDMAGKEMIAEYATHFFDHAGLAMIADTANRFQDDAGARMIARVATSFRAYAGQYMQAFSCQDFYEPAGQGRTLPTVKSLRREDYWLERLREEILRREYERLEAPETPSSISQPESSQRQPKKWWQIF